MRPGWFCVKGKVFPFIQGAGLESCAHNRHAHTHADVLVSHCVCLRAGMRLLNCRVCVFTFRIKKNEKGQKPNSSRNLLISAVLVKGFPITSPFSFQLSADSSQLTVKGPESPERCTLHSLHRRHSFLCVHQPSRCVKNLHA